MKKQPTWDKYEVALLIEAYIMIKNGNTNKVEALQNLSDDLRKKAKNEGMEIDETFRNLNGMQWQIGFIDCAFKNSGYGTHMPSKLFQKMVDMYLSERTEFDKILSEAKDRVKKSETNINGNCDMESKLIADERMLLDIISKKFAYGFRLGSPIELMKLKEYAEKENIVIKENDKEIIEIISKNGFTANGKLYVFAEEEKSQINCFLDEIFKHGHSVVYYEKFMDEYREWLDENHVVSETILKECFLKTRSDLFYAKNFVSREKNTEEAAVIGEMLRIWKDETLLSFEEISDRLPYIPVEKIKFYLSASKFFVWVSEGRYTCIRSFVITNDEEKEILDFVTRECDVNGFASLSNIPLGDIIEQNYELTETAIFYAIYNRCLSDSFYLNGKILTKERTNIDAVTLLKCFCESKEECTLEEASEKVEELTGVKDKRIAYAALYDVMIRVDEQRFVADRSVDFDIAAIDRAITPFVKDGFGAIKEITTFATFPICGQMWSHFLIESYCYRFSRDYRLRTNIFNGRNVGAIVSASIDWEYQELLARAVARANVRLEKEVIGQYLFETGYVGRSKFNLLDDIVEEAKKIREEDV